MPFQLQKPKPFNDENAQAFKSDYVGFCVSQGHKLQPERVCEDVAFAIAPTPTGGTACGVADGHGGAQCAQYVGSYFEKFFSEGGGGDMGA